jgi:predicted transposase/invertase (TIGR01784 family)
MDPEALPTELCGSLVLRAFEELKMLTQNDLERERYEARRKAQLVYNTGLKEAREEGRQEGRQEGRREEKIGIIHLCERLLHRPQTPMEKLVALPLEELTRLADELQTQVLAQA